MINTYTVDALAGQSIIGGKYRLVLDRKQEEALYELLTKNLRIDMPKARMYFLDTQGYMGTDRECIDLWVTRDD